MSNPLPSDGRRFGPIVSVDWLLDHIDEPALTLVDVRPPGAYGLGHIAGAVDLDLYTLKLSDSRPESIAAFNEQARRILAGAGISPDDRVILYEDFSGATAALGVWLLDYLGLGNGAMLDGGLRAWDAAGGAITTEPVTPTQTELSVDPRPELLATVDEIIASLKEERPPVQLVDTRSDVEHLAGTIPGSIPLEWVNALAPTGTLRPPDELRSLFERAGLEPNVETITYCGSGFRSAHTYIVLKALGYPHVRNYAPSWGEWGTRGDLPIVNPGRL